MRSRLAVVALLLASCTSQHASGPVAEAPTSQLGVTVTATTCTMDRATVPAGPLVVTVSSNHALPGSEVELRGVARVLGEEEAVRDGHTGGFSLPVSEGSLTVLCLAGGKTVQKTLTVVRAAPRHLSAAQATRQQQLTVAAAQWHTWVQGQLDQLVVATRAFGDAVRAGDEARARALYGPARVYYERVEPVAESFGDLDGFIDARLDDVQDPALWTGFHRMEKTIFQQGTVKGLSGYATTLDVQVTQLDHLDQGITTTGSDLANGATSLLEEVARTKITGEEERYSHLDLVDLTANVDGAEKAFSLLRPALAGADPLLDSTLAARFVDLDTAIDALRTGPGPTDFPLFTTIDQLKRQALSDAVDGVSEPLARVAAAIVV